MELKQLAEQDSLEGKTLQQAKVIEGSLRDSGVHAGGVIITTEDIRELVPVAVAKDEELLITQYDNSVVENAGLLKMDFLGLRTLTIINDAIELIEQNHGVKIVPDDIPLDDVKTYELFQRAERSEEHTSELQSRGHLVCSLLPDKFDDRSE